MIKNNKISANINQWEIEYDPCGFSANEQWLFQAEKTEDILQLSHVYEEGPIIDVGYYNDFYRIFVVYNKNWDNPHEVFKSKEPDKICNKIYSLIDKYANG